MSNKDKKFSGTDELMHMSNEVNLDDYGPNSYQGEKDDSVITESAEVMGGFSEEEQGL